MDWFLHQVAICNLQAGGSIPVCRALVRAEAEVIRAGTPTRGWRGARGYENTLKVEMTGIGN